jgi:transposase
MGPTGLSAGRRHEAAVQQLGRLEGESATLREQVDRLQRANQQLQTRVRKLTGQVEELRRAAKRQATPFSKNTPTPDPRRPGRKPGAAYGRVARRLVAQRVDRVISVGLPAVCPHCGEQLEVERVACQDQEDLPPPRSMVVARYEAQIRPLPGLPGSRTQDQGVPRAA